MPTLTKRFINGRAFIGAMAYAFALSLMGCIPLRMREYNYQPAQVRIGDRWDTEVRLNPTPGTRDSSRIRRNPYTLVFSLTVPPRLGEVTWVDSILLVGIADSAEHRPTIHSVGPTTNVSSQASQWVSVAEKLQLTYQDYALTASYFIVEEGDTLRMPLQAVLRRTPRSYWIYWPWVYYYAG